ncbi:MAG: putative lipid II flippase FtsW [Clostridia bacterium]|nr:putative lipid II flippase FtsW [Clostridia bacterium]
MANVKKRNKFKLISNEPVDFTLLITVFILLGLGIITVLSASSPTSLAESGNSYRYVYKQGISAIIGIVIMFFTSKMDYHIFQKHYKLIYGICIAALLSVSFIGVSSGGAKRWINLGFTTFQPSELAKVGVIIFYSAWLTKNKDKLKNFKIGFVYPFLMIAPAVAIILGLQTHFSASLVIVLIISILMVMAGTRILHFVFVGVPAAVSGIIGIFTLGEGFRLQRLITFLDPWQDMTGSGWQIIQSLYAIGSGGLFGVGLGDSKQKYLYIPEPHNDFIFAVLAEELGFIGCVFVILLFAIFVWRGIVISMNAPDMFGSLMAVGITSMIGLQVLINIAVVTSSMPVTGMALPFFSYGGTALIIILASVGILLNISRSRNKI